MRGASLRRFTPDPQVGGGWLREIVDEGGVVLREVLKVDSLTQKGPFPKVMQVVKLQCNEQ